MTESLNILGVKITVTNLSDACRSIENWIKQCCKVYVCVAPVSTIVDCQRDTGYRDIINNAAMTTPDGMPLVWIGSLRGKKAIRRTYGPELMLAFCGSGVPKGYRHYFYGGAPRTNQRLIERLKILFPGIKIVGNFAPAFLKIGELEKERILREINEARPDVLWVGLGSPKQDYWMYYHRDKLDVPVMIGAGAAFDFIAGTKPQAPRWMRQTGLEWLFRLCCEPHRLWKRYLVGNTQFIYFLIKDSVRRRLSHS